MGIPVQVEYIGIQQVDNIMTTLSFILLALTIVTNTVLWIVLYYSKVILKENDYPVSYFYTPFKQFAQLSKLAKEKPKFKGLYLLSIISLMVSIIVFISFLAVFISQN
jgi:hypothetical protein